MRSQSGACWLRQLLLSLFSAKVFVYFCFEGIFDLTSRLVEEMCKQVADLYKMLQVAH